MRDKIKDIVTVVTIVVFIPCWFVMMVLLERAKMRQERLYGEGDD